MIEHFTGFYTSRPFWAGEPPIDIKALLNIENQTQLSEIQKQLYDLMSAITFSYETNNFRLWICKDGMILVHIKELEKEIDKIRDNGDFEAESRLLGQYLNYLNCLYLLLDSVLIEFKQFSYFNLSEITNRDVVRLQFEDGEYIFINTPMESIASIYQKERYLLTYDTITSMYSRQSLSKDVFDLLFAQYSIATANTSLLNNLAEVAKSLSEYKIGNYSTSLVLAWFVSESAIIRIWNKYLDSSNRDYPDGIRRISTERKKILTGRDYMVSVISNILELSGIIPFPTYQNINAVRGFRNKVVHGDSNFTCSAEHCQKAIELALNLTLEGTGLKVLPNYTHSLPGL
ncbi:hypothetical protein NIES2109_25800 [Nostoc sp. HK-01]|nr:hypothetical protein NIES2109_25800 [Nostoc sp. HK-01]